MSKNKNKKAKNTSPLQNRPLEKNDFHGKTHVHTEKSDVYNADFSNTEHTKHYTHTKKHTWKFEITKILIHGAVTLLIALVTVYFAIYNIDRTRKSEILKENISNTNKSIVDLFKSLRVIPAQEYTKNKDKKHDKSSFIFINSNVQANAASILIYGNQNQRMIAVELLQKSRKFEYEITILFDASNSEEFNETEKMTYRKKMDEKIFEYISSMGFLAGKLTLSATKYTDELSKIFENDDI